VRKEDRKEKTVASGPIAKRARKEERSDKGGKISGRAQLMAEEGEGFENCQLSVVEREKRKSGSCVHRARCTPANTKALGRANL